MKKIFWLFKNFLYICNNKKIIKYINKKKRNNFGFFKNISYICINK